MPEIIGKLNAQLKVLSIDPAKQADRQIKKDDVLKQKSEAFTTFSNFFLSQTSQDPHEFRTSAFKLLWKYVLPWKEIEGKVGNPEDPGDGLLYDHERVLHATSVLEDLHQAWINSPGSTPCPPPESLSYMGKICLILTGMNQQQLLEDFVDAGIVDAHLGDLEKEQVEKILKKHHVAYAATFVTEQYRAVPPKWEAGHHLNVEDETPLPLVYEFSYREGSYGIVERVRDSLSGNQYARKQQIVSSEHRTTAANRRHIEEEAKRLKDLEHRHVIKLVKSYQRGRVYGILLSPAATSDLERLLVRYYKDKFSAGNSCQDSEWLRPIFLTAFGCLSKGLAYIHSRNIRHKDVKPANILYEKSMDDRDARFIWADFGLAYDFSATGDSKTKGNKIYSKRYAAPEVVATYNRVHSEKRTNTNSSLNQIAEMNEDNSTEIELDPQTANNIDDTHGRKTDIFSLGCIFLELLGGLVYDKLPLDKETPQDPREPMFSNYLKELEDWAQQKQSDGKGRELASLFQITLKMMSRNPDDRPVIGDVVRSMARFGGECFCKACWQELPEHERSIRPQNHRHPERDHQASRTVFSRRVNSGWSQTAMPSKLRRILS